MPKWIYLGTFWRIALKSYFTAYEPKLDDLPLQSVPIVKFGLLSKSQEQISSFMCKKEEVGSKEEKDNF